MAQIPDYERRLSVNSPPGVSVRNTWNETAAGAGIAREIGRFGAALGAKVNEWEDAEVLRSVNEFKRRVMTYHNDPDKGMLNTRKLGGAMGAADDADRWMDEQMWEIRGSLGSDRAMANFDRLAVGVRDSQTLSNMKWESSQISAYRDAEADGLIANTLDDLAAGYRDPEMLASARERILDAAAPKLEGLGPEAREKAVADIEDTIAWTVAERLIKDDPLGAVAWLREHKDMFSEGAYQKARDALKKAVKPYEQEAIRDQILAKFPGNEGAARKYIMKNYSGAEETEIWRMVEAAYSDERRIRKQAEADAREMMSNTIAASTSKADAIAAVTQSTLSDKDKETMLKHIEQRYKMSDGSAKAAGFDPAAYAQMEQYIHNTLLNYPKLTPDQAYAIVNGVSAIFKGRVQDSDLKSAVRSIIKLGNKSDEMAAMGKPGAVDPGLSLEAAFGKTRYTNPEKYAEGWAVDMSKAMNGGVADPREVNKWLYTINMELEREKAMKGGRELTSEEKMDVIDYLFEKQTVERVEKGIFFDGTRQESYYRIQAHPDLPEADVISKHYEVPDHVAYKDIKVDEETDELYYFDEKGVSYTIPMKRR